ncbi:ABC transporter permease [Rhodococcus rhodochrous]|uniref:ABC transporter permease n=1 Tax=Rhodococcus TaxID=1827 RepID=UPI0009BBCC84|nr:MULTISPECIES: ABC transporter permease [Rhodococcus]MDC3727513.1 ABC transporter permease [Rhodococcus sp. Rp3]MDO1485934.1 ABC transporter permease [Rhodococcus rhodochrous]TWH44781.1 peptide/nickel transport system permease protein [Rhodococcus rhodochrous J38]SNV23838.1 ABC transporter permease [Rhodococcus rhodochrous]
MTVTRPVPTGLTAPPALPAEKATCPSRRDRSGVGIAVLKRIALVPPMLLAITTFVFLAMRLIPGSPASSLATNGTQGLTTAEIEANTALINEQLGLDRPLWQQYVDFLRSFVTFDLGSSYYGGNDVANLLWTALPATLELAVAAMFLAVLIGVTGGIVAALTKDTWIDTGIRALSTLTFALPWFALGVASIYLFGVVLGWLPVLGRMPSSLDYTPTTNFVLLDAILQNRPDLVMPWTKHLVLPATTLAISMAGFFTRMARTAVLDVRGEDFIRTARMKGASESRIVFRHLLPNASLPIVTALGIQFGSLIGGAVITESVFSYPGIGNLLVSSVIQRDYLVVQGAVLAIATVFILVNLVVDLIQIAIDPRLRKGMS